jgi:AcrR family transcriptional regulator
MDRSPRLDQARIVKAAMAVADRIGIERLTIRRLAAELGSSPMAIYHYLADKEAILDALVDEVYQEIGLPQVDEPWPEALERRAVSARAVLRRHPWTIALLDSRTSPGPATLGHLDSLVGFCRQAGLSLAQTLHAVALLDAFVYGFVMQELSLPFAAPEEVESAVGDIVEQIPADAYPHLTEMAISHVLQPGFDFGDEFGYGLRLILQSLEGDFAAEGDNPT